MWSLFRGFELNIMDFAQISDFLLAAFKQPNTFIQSLITIASAIFAIKRFSRERKDLQTKRLSKSWGFSPRSLRVLDTLVIIVLAVVIITSTVWFFVIPFQWGSWDAKKIKNGNSLKVVVQLKGSNIPGTLSKIENETFLIGTAGKFVFFYDNTKKCAHIVPIANILEIHSVPVDSS